MNERAQPDHDLSTETKAPWLWILFAGSVVLLLAIYRNSLNTLLTWWETPEYSHGYMIPLVAIFLLWQRVNELPAVMQRGSWTGIGALSAGLFLYVLGTLSSADTLVQYGFLISFYGVALSFIGVNAMRMLWVVPVYLIFMVPLPSFFYLTLSNQMQLISSQLGVGVIRLFGISVHLEGNVIDLGAMQLQVAEACSGMRYLFPFMSFGFLISYLYRGPLWQRIFLFVSTVPITILLNSFRIGVIGVTVDKWGLKMAEGFLHDFEGWIVFMVCIAVLFAELTVFHLFQSSRTSVFDKINLDLPRLTVGLKDFTVTKEAQRPFVFAVISLLLLSPILFQIKERTELVPPRTTFAEFPMTHSGWSGRPIPLSEEILDILKLSDYLQANYVSTAFNEPVNFYVAWYASQRKGSVIHSPRMCIPGGGWEIDELKPYSVPATLHISGRPIKVNRAIIRKDKVAQLVYYWFDGRGRNIVDEYAAKWLVVQDSLLERRSDGALVRVVTMVPEGTSIEAADQRLQKFVQDFYPLLPAYVP